MNYASFARGFLLAACCCGVSWLLGLLLFSRRKGGVNVATRKRSGSSTAFAPEKSIKPFVRDGSRVYTIWNKLSGEVARAVGLPYAEALTWLGWDEKDCEAVDLGPTKQKAAVTKYQGVTLKPGDFPGVGSQK